MQQSKKNLTILIVEDDEGDILSIKRALKKCKLDNPIFVAHDGVEALEILREGKQVVWPYLILLDINMPRMNGLQFLEELRQDEELKKAVVFVLTTSDDEKDMVSAYEKNIAGYLLKQNVLDDFLSLVSLVDQFSLTVRYPSTHSQQPSNKPIL
ncbi:response regulator [Alteromonas sp. a30]|uniref:response regulator n=1 Tax=Alteromonas sp. a30 TaxID=2730917 RepID=UPI0022804C1C|nr:response regulator [Alteromonas sp. a30]MCY7296717.1 response regulator [Alteromonas sp. a30]